MARRLWGAGGTRRLERCRFMWTMGVFILCSHWIPARARRVRWRLAGRGGGGTRARARERTEGGVFGHLEALVRGDVLAVAVPQQLDLQVGRHVLRHQRQVARLCTAQHARHTTRHDTTHTSVSRQAPGVAAKERGARGCVCVPRQAPMNKTMCGFRILLRSSSWSSWVVVGRRGWSWVVAVG